MEIVMRMFEAYVIFCVSATLAFGTIHVYYVWAGGFFVECLDAITGMNTAFIVFISVLLMSFLYLISI